MVVDNTLQPCCCVVQVLHANILGEHMLTLFWCLRPFPLYQFIASIGRRLWQHVAVITLWLGALVLGSAHHHICSLFQIWFAKLDFYGWALLVAFLVVAARPWSSDEHGLFSQVTGRTSWVISVWDGSSPSLFLLFDSFLSMYIVSIPTNRSRVLVRCARFCRCFPATSCISSVGFCRLQSFPRVVAECHTAEYLTHCLARYWPKRTNNWKR